jgi:pimeloyl-ACP methyl ester carboxylesterase
LSRPASPPSWEGWLEVGHLSVHAVVWGVDAPLPRRGGAGRRLILLHGLGGTSIHWELVGAALAGRLNGAVVAVDLAGFGQTRARPADATVFANAQLVTRLLEMLGPSELVGNSMGGAVAIRVAARRPDLVTSLLLVTPVLPQPPWPEPPVVQLPHNWPAAVPGVGPLAVALYANATSDERVVDDRIRRSFHHPCRVDQRLRCRLIELTRLRRRFAEAPHTYAAATRSLFAYATAADEGNQDIARIRCPTSIVHGDHDRLVPLRLAEAALKRRPDWRLEVIPDCGHTPQMELPERFLEACARALRPPPDTTSSSPPRAASCSK